MNARVLSVLLVAGIASATSAQDARHSSAAPQLGIWLGVVRSRFSTTDKTGTCFAVGRLGSKLTLVTAAHVVYAAERPAKAVEVSLQSCPVVLPAQLHEQQTNEDLDMAVLTLELPPECSEVLAASSFPTLAIGILDAAVRGVTGQQLVLWGRAESGELRTTRGARLESWLRSEFIMDGVSIPEGMSGGLVTSEHGELVGMITHNPRAARIDFVVAELRNSLVNLNLLGPFAMLHLRGHPLGARLVVDGGPEEAIRETRYIEVGTHSIAVSAPGYQSTPAVALRFEPGETHVLCADMAPPISHTWAAVRFPILIGSGALLIAGGITAAFASSSAKSFRDNPTRDDYDSTRTLNTTADVLFASGAALALGFAVGHLFWNPSTRSSLNGTCD